MRFLKTLPARMWAEVVRELRTHLRAISAKAGTPSRI